MTNREKKQTAENIVYNIFIKNHDLLYMWDMVQIKPNQICKFWVTLLDVGLCWCVQVQDTLVSSERLLL